MLSRDKLHAYQTDAISLIQQHRRLGIWAAMGSGKSVITLTALDELNLVEDVFPALVLAPLRVARSTWPSEVENWAHLAHLRVSAITGTESERIRALKREADIYTCNFENIPWMIAHLGDEWPFKTIVADEASRLSSFRLRQGSVRMRALGKVAWRSDRFIELTGSPGANGVKNLWGQSWFLDKGERLGRTFSAFEARWFKKGYDGFSLVPMDHAQSEIQDRLKDICFTIDMPAADAPIVNVIKVDLPSAARKAYREMERDFFTQLEKHEIETANAATKTQALLQICNGALYHDDDRNWAKVHDAKLEALDSIIEEANGAPIFLAYQFKHDVERILKRYPQARLLKTRKDEDDWNAGRIGLLLAHEASAGHGLSLQHGGNILVRFGLGWSLEGYEQILERIGPRRQKQSGYDRPVYDHTIIARDTIDEDVLERLFSKRSVQEILLEAMKREKSGARTVKFVKERIVGETFSRPEERLRLLAGEGITIGI